jgi:hypothetical protein
MQQKSSGQFMYLKIKIQQTSYDDRQWDGSDKKKIQLMLLYMIFIDNRSTVQELRSDLPINNNNILIKSKSRFLRFDYTKVRERKCRAIKFLCFIHKLLILVCIPLCTT